MASDPVLLDTMAMLGLKGRVEAAIDLMPLIRSGLPSTALERMARHLDLSAVATIESLGLAKRTIARRLHEHKPLSTEESERVVRRARVFAEAKHVLDSEAKARLWLQKPNRWERAGDDKKIRIQMAFEDGKPIRLCGGQTRAYVEWGGHQRLRDTP
jgi:putative toxin-antitoxin system antitoxin component (TIGR02293 family)